MSPNPQTRLRIKVTHPIELHRQPDLISHSDLGLARQPRHDRLPAQLEAGERIAELTHEAAAILERQQHLHSDLDVDDAIDRILWRQARRYRVSISIDDKHKPAERRQKLFKHYDVSANGDVSRRRAETMHFDDLRQWMADFSDLVAAKIKAIANV